MAVEVALGTPLAEALSGIVQPRLVEAGWTSEDDSSLTEYVILMLVNNKTQEQIASELATDLLPEGETGTVEFAQWLFDQVRRLTAGSGQQQSGAMASQQLEGPNQTQNQSAATQNVGAAQGDAMMSEGSAPPSETPTGPKAMRGGGKQSGRGGRMNMGKTNDPLLHRTRGNDRINSHSRQTPRGPRHDQNRMMRPHMQQQLGAAVGMNMPNSGPGSFMSPQQQMQFMAMMEEQARMMAQFMPGFMGPGMPPNFQNGQQGRSLSDRIEAPNRGRGGGRGGRGGKKPHQNGHGNANKDGDDTAMGDDDANKAQGDPSSSMEVESSQQSSDPSSTVCRFNLKCTRKDCPYAHQSPAAPEGISMDLSDTCSYGAACKNHKCTAKHPSPAQKLSYQADEQCKFWPNCTNPNCGFKHPSMPICRNGGDCTLPDCKFTHLQTACKFNPCLNARCPFKHAEGQRGASFGDHVWTANGQSSNGHVSERKFVDDAAGEELIKPETTENSEGIVT